MLSLSIAPIAGSGTKREVCRFRSEGTSGVVHKFLGGSGTSMRSRWCRALELLKLWERVDDRRFGFASYNPLRNIKRGDSEFLGFSRQSHPEMSCFSARTNL